MRINSGYKVGIQITTAMGGGGGILNRPILQTEHAAQGEICGAVIFVWKYLDYYRLFLHKH